MFLEVQGSSGWGDDKNRLWIDRRQIQPVGKCWFVKVKGETLRKDEVFDFNSAC